MMMITRASKATSTVVRAAPRVVFVIFVVTVASLFTIRTTASPLAAGCEPGRPSPRPPAEHPGVPCRRLSETLSGRRGLRQALNNPECSFDSGDCDGIPWDTDSSNIASCCLQVCTGEDACEGRGHDEETCLSVGCCRWDPQPEGDCWSLVGTEKCDPEPDQMCYHAQLCSNNYHCGGPTHIWIYYTVHWWGRSLHHRRCLLCVWWPPWEVNRERQRGEEVQPTVVAAVGGPRTTGRVSRIGS